MAARCPFRWRKSPHVLDCSGALAAAAAHLG